MNEKQEKRINRSYDKQFKVDAVRHLIESGKTIVEVAEDLGVERSNLGRWKRQQFHSIDQRSTLNGEELKPSEMEVELRRLRRQLSD